MGHWLYIHLGLNSGNSSWYLFPSGPLSYLAVLSLFGVLAGFWRTHTCHRKWWCWRHPHFQLEGSPYMLCGIHHPDNQMTVEQAVKHHIHLRKKREAEGTTKSPVDLEVP